MNVNDLLAVGSIKKSFGLKGDVKIAFEAFFLEYTQGLTALFVEENGNKIPYFIEKIQLQFDGTGVVKFEDVNVKEVAMRLNGKTIFVDPKQFEGLSEAAEDEDYYGDLIGLDAVLLNAENLVLGKIEAIEYLPEHECAIVKHKGLEIMLPLHDDIFIEYDDNQAFFALDKEYLSIYFED